MGEIRELSPRTIALLNPAIGSLNSGDQIILESGRAELQSVFASDFLVEFSTREAPGRRTLRLLKKADCAVVVGTNLLSSQMGKSTAWRLRLRHALQLGNVVLMGVGWHSYQNAPDFYTRTLLQKLLHSTKLHSVRDSYSERQLRAAGLSNVVNTGCPTLWRLSPEHCAAIPTQRAPQVLTTLTDYRRDEAADRTLLRFLLAHYDAVHLWLQGSRDGEYAAQLLAEFSAADRARLHFVPPQMAAYDAALQHREIDYLGTRLHAGIRALHHGRRTLILAVDNRATEMGTDFNLPVAKRGDESAMRAFVQSSPPVEIRLPLENIERWKTQFGD